MSPRSERAWPRIPRAATHSLEIVEAEARRLERLVGDILDLAKLNAHRFTVMTEEVDMEQLLQHAYETFTDEARRRAIDYRVELDAHPVIVSDGDRVLQIVGNLLSNAFKATPDGGEITPRAQPAERDDQRLRRGHGPRDPGGEPRAALPPVRLRGRRRHGPRARDREGALGRARRADRRRLGARPRLAVRAAPPRAWDAGRPAVLTATPRRRGGARRPARAARAPARSGRGARSGRATGR